MATGAPLPTPTPLPAMPPQAARACISMAIAAAIIALVALFFTSVKLVKNFPRKVNTGTIIGDYQKLTNNSFEVTFTFTFKVYEGEETKEILFSENWIYEN